MTGKSDNALNLDELDTPIGESEVEELSQDVQSAIESVTPADAPVTTPAADSTPKVPELPKQNIVQTHAVFVENKKFDANRELVAVPSDYFERVDTKLADYKPEEDAPNQEWAATVGEGSRIESRDFRATLSAEDSEWHQELKSETAAGGKLAASYPVFKPDKDASTGPLAVQKFTSAMGLGSIFRLPLYNSGVWITLRPPSESDLLEFHRVAASDMIELGRRTSGVIFSNLSAVNTERIVNLIMRHVYSCSLDVPTKDLPAVLPNILLCQDIPALIWGFACTIYPNGFQYQRACTSDYEKCKHIVRERLALSKISWTNRAALSKLQIDHMSEMRAGSHSLEKVKRYQEEMLCAQRREVTLMSGNEKEVGFMLKVPTINEHISTGQRWITDIIEMTNSALGLESDARTRNHHITTQAQSTAMRQQLHWVKSITYDEQTIEDPGTLSKIFDVMSSDDTLRRELDLAVAKYVADTTVTVIGIPTFDCPNCGKEQKSEKPFHSHPNVIPIDAYNTFFILLMQRVESILSR